MANPYPFKPPHIRLDPSDANPESAARRMEDTGDYRILRRLTPPKPFSCNQPMCRRAIYLDVETTGLDDDDEIIELAMIPFQYTLGGQVCGLGQAFDQFNEPTRPISEEISQLTGITPDMVKGHRIDRDEVRALLNDANLIIAHNAAFDRQKCEAFMPEFRDKPWACSLNEIDWRSEGHESAKLPYLAMEYGFFFEGHRAWMDCHAGIKLLTMPLASSGDLALSHLLNSARRTGWRVFAVNAPFAAKDALKARGYRWAPETAALHPKCWWRDVEDDDLPAEQAFLAAEVYSGSDRSKVYRVDALNRYSTRIGEDGSDTKPAKTA